MSYTYIEWLDIKTSYTYMEWLGVSGGEECVHHAMSDSSVKLQKHDVSTHGQEVSDGAGVCGVGKVLNLLLYLTQLSAWKVFQIFYKTLNSSH